LSLARCPRCGEIFSKGKFDICPSCRSSENEKIDLLKHYVDENPKATVEMLVTVSGLKEEEILDYIRENRLIIESDVLKITCESCGETIITGTICRACRQKMANKFSAALDPLKRKRDTPR